MCATLRDLGRMLPKARMGRPLPNSARTCEEVAGDRLNHDTRMSAFGVSTLSAWGTGTSIAPYAWPRSVVIVTFLVLDPDAFARAGQAGDTAASTDHRQRLLGLD